MKRDYFSQDTRSERRFGEHRGGTCMALIDGRFLIWLAQQGAMGATGESVNRQGLLSLLSQALSQAALDVDLRRIYWYSDRSDGLVIDDQIVRLVQAHDADGGAHGGDGADGTKAPVDGAAPDGTCADDRRAGQH